MKIAGARVRILTFAEGLLAKLAHDLELGVGAFGAEIGADEATLRVPVESLEVRGVRRGGRLDTTTLSAADRDAILAKMRSDVFHGDGALALVVTRDAVRVRPPHRPEVRAPLALDLGPTSARGSFELSLAALGASPVKGPMNAFRVKDRVRIEFELDLSA